MQLSNASSEKKGTFKYRIKDEMLILRRSIRVMVTGIGLA